MAVIGIDLGTTNSLASVWKDGKCQLIPNSFGEYLTPSVVGIDENGDIIVGKIAKERLVSHPNSTCASFKRFMGTDMQLKIGDKKFTAQELSSFVLRQLKDDAERFLGEPVTEALVSVPAYFDDNGRNATKISGELASLFVERIVNEPSAAALAYRQQYDEDKIFLIFDFGGGTLDISVVDIFENIIEIVAVAGDNHLGGDDFNMAIANYFCKQNDLDYKELSDDVKAIIIRQAEMCKIALNESDTTAMAVVIDEKTYSMTLDTKKLVELCGVLFKKIEIPILKALHDAEIGLNEIDEVILVGGSSRMMVVQKYLKHLLKCKIKNSVSPDEIVAIGVGVAAGIKSRNEDIKDVLLTDICPFTLGTGVVNDLMPGNNLFSPIIERNSTLPISNAQIYETSCDYQRQILMEIYQGESMYCNENILLGDVKLNVPKRLKGEEKIELRYTYDINGILEVEAEVLSTKEVKSKLIVNKNLNMSEEELKKRLDELQSLKISPAENDDNRYILARAERLYKENFGEVRSAIGRYIFDFSQVLVSQNGTKIRRYRNFLERYFDVLEGIKTPLEAFPEQFEDIEEYDDENWENWE